MDRSLIVFQLLVSGGNSCKPPLRDIFLHRTWLGKPQKIMRIGGESTSGWSACFVLSESNTSMARQTSSVKYMGGNEDILSRRLRFVSNTFLTRTVGLMTGSLVHGLLLLHSIRSLK